MDSTIDFPGGIGLRRKRRRRIVWLENGGRGLSKAASSLPWKADYRTELNIVNTILRCLTMNLLTLGLVGVIFTLVRLAFLEEPRPIPEMFFKSVLLAWLLARG